MPDHGALLLQGATVPGRGSLDVLVTDGAIAAVGRDVETSAVASDATVVDLAGHVLLPAGVETHAHLDKALLVGREANQAGDLAGAIDANRRAYPSLTSEDIRNRALSALAIAVRRGYTLVRSHVNIETGIGVAAVRALLEVSTDVSSSVDLELVGLVGFPVTGPEGRENRALLDESLDLGVDVVGGAPALDRSPDDAVRWLVRRAADAQRPIDLHLDETLDAGSMTLRTFAAEVERHGLGGSATASHCVSLGQQDPSVAREISVMLRDVGVSVVVLPQSNLSLQGRSALTRTLRGTAPARLLKEEGVLVVGGGDNWRDMFNPLGRIDPFETAALLSGVCHLTLADAYACVSTEAAMALGRGARAIEVGAPAELLAVRASNLEEAIADASEHRTVIHRGAIVSQTTVKQEPSGNWPDM